MRKVAVGIFVAVLAILIGLFFSVKTRSAQSAYQNDGHITIVRPKVINNEVELVPEDKNIPTTGDPIALTLQALLADADEHSSDRAIPKGTKLVKVTLKDGVAQVELSKEFMDLNKSGDSAISAAQNSLLKSLEQFPSIEKLTVTVDGKVFEDGSYGKWENIPVRDVKSGKESAK